MKKNIILFILISIFMIPIITYAAPSGKLSAGHIDMECVYDNGVSLTFYGAEGNYGISFSDFKLANSVAPPYSTALTVFYKEAAFAKEVIQSATCPSAIDYMVVEQQSGDNKVSFQMYYRHSDNKYFVSGDNYDSAFFTRQHIGGFKPDSGWMMGFSVAQDSALSKRMVLYYNSNDNSKYDEGEEMIAFQFKLVSERIYFNEEVEPKRSWAFKSEGQQAASTPEYIKVSEYVSENGTTFKVLEKDKNITKVSASLNTYDENYTQFVCFKPSVKNIKNDRNDMAYYFSDVRHTLTYKTKYKSTEVETKAVGLSCTTAGFSLYQEVSLDEYNENASTATSICDVIPETALLISTFIYYLGLIIPVLLIVFTAIDITKLVISGNLDEELPKKKKVILTRFIVAVVFFFIPIIIEIFVSSNYGTDFGDVSCLFEQNSTPSNSGGSGDPE